MANRRQENARLRGLVVDYKKRNEQLHRLLRECRVALEFTNYNMEVSVYVCVVCVYDSRRRKEECRCMIWLKQFKKTTKKKF